MQQVAYQYSLAYYFNGYDFDTLRRGREYAKLHDVVFDVFDV